MVGQPVVNEPPVWPAPDDPRLAKRPANEQTQCAFGWFLGLWLALSLAALAFSLFSAWPALAAWLHWAQLAFVAAVPSFGSLLFIACLTYLAVVGYFLPTYFGRRHKHHNAQAIFVLNLLLGWTYLGWAVAMVWAFTKSPAGQLEG